MGWLEIDSRAVAADRRGWELLTSVLKSWKQAENGNHEKETIHSAHTSFAEWQQQPCADERTARREANNSAPARYCFRARIKSKIVGGDRFLVDS